MKKRTPKERKVINILKSDLDLIKQYCDANAYKMGAWLVKIAKDEINAANNQGKN